MMYNQKGILNTKPEQITLNKEASVFLMRILENPPKPKEKLQKAVKKYRSTSKS